jgi:cell wall-associated NlpC family hydrolase
LGPSQVSTEYWLADTEGSVWSFGGANSYKGLPNGTKLAGPVVEVTPTPDDGGYWLVSSGGEVFTFGNAVSFGCVATRAHRGPVVGLTPTPGGNGYWIVTAAGEVFAFGDAVLFGPSGPLSLGSPVVGLVATPDGGGYWLALAGGGVLNFGDAPYLGSAGGKHLPSPVVDMASAPDGHGYWLVLSDGDVFAYGDAHYAGGAPVGAGGDPAERIVAGSSGAGYWVVDQDGTATPLGDASGAPGTLGLVLRPVTPGDKAVLFALSQLGKPYIWGGSGPKGYDCSGLAYRSWYVATGRYIPRISDNQYDSAGEPVAWADLRAGDLIFWGSNQTKWSSVYHTAIYVGGSQIVESTSDQVQVNTVYQWGGSNLMPHGKRPLG